jgi:galactose mutarotase-like enzyme
MSVRSLDTQHTVGDILVGQPLHWSFSWDRGQADIHATGAALRNLVLELDDGSTIRPLAEAPWIGDPAVATDKEIAAHLRQLGGEWPCVPFGTTIIDPHHHGYCTDNDWHVTSQGVGTISLAIDYPATHPIARLERRISGVPGTAAIDMELAVEVRRTCKLPLGLHPIFRLPDKGRLQLDPGAFSRGLTFPKVFEPGVSRLKLGAEFRSLDTVPLARGGAADLSELPADLREEIIQLEAVAGSVGLFYPDGGHTVRLDWNPVDFPSLVLWLSDCGREAAPWSKRFRGIGVEPVNGYFDDASLSSHAPAGVSVGRRFTSGERWSTRYSISASRFDGGQDKGKAG